MRRLRPSAAAGPYAAVLGGSFRRYSTYRVATAAGVFTGIVSGFVLVFTCTVLWAGRRGACRGPRGAGGQWWAAGTRAGVSAVSRARSTAWAIAR